MTDTAQLDLLAGTEPATELTIDVTGDPVPQGSMFAIMRAGRPVVIADNSSALGRWRRDITSAAKARATLAGWLTTDGPVTVAVTFWLERPAAAKKRHRPHVRPDLDKLVRAVLDALTEAQIWTDDARVVRIAADKHYATTTTGVRIIVTPLEAVIL